MFSDDNLRGVRKLIFSVDLFDMHEVVHPLSVFLKLSLMIVVPTDCNSLVRWAHLGCVNCLSARLESRDLKLERVDCLSLFLLLSFGLFWISQSILPFWKLIEDLTYASEPFWVYAFSWVVFRFHWILLQMAGGIERTIELGVHQVIS